MSGFRGQMQMFLAGWRDDLHPAWRSVFSEVEPAHTAVLADLLYHENEPVFPARLGQPHASAPAGAHLLRAFDRVAPEDVRAIIVGQDPYPNIARATGRAFEAGDLVALGQTQPAPAKSLKRVMQCLATERSGRAGYTANDPAWSQVVTDADREDLRLPGPRALFNYRENQGLLLLNTARAPTHFEAGGAEEQLQGHIPLWEPVIHAVLKHLVNRESRSVVILAWGGPARRAVEASGVKDLSRWNVTAAVAGHGHPAAANADGPLLFQSPNFFWHANQFLVSIGGEVIVW